MKGEFTTGNNVRCLIPAYPAPETLNVDVSFNGLDYSNDNVTFGYIDPFVLSVEPRLISAKGGTRVSLKGYGFVKMEYEKMKAAFKSEGVMLTCTAGNCTKPYTVVDEKRITLEAFP